MSPKVKTADQEKVPVVIDNEAKQPRVERCWFAVSGSHAGEKLRVDPKYSMDKFPGTISGRPVGHGEIFDSIGGIYLEPRDQPYLDGQGEIDKAVHFTFDSIVVAPGMKAELRNLNGDIIYQGTGPVFVEATTYANQGYFEGLKSRSDLPKWMTDYIGSISAIPTADLHPVRSVKVSVVPGGPCDKK